MRTIAGLNFSIRKLNESGLHAAESGLHAIFVNKQGKRFVNEYAPRDVYTKAAMEQCGETKLTLANNRDGRSGVMNTILGGRIRVLRESKALTQEQVAEKMNCTRQKYARIEKGLIDISYSSITTIANILGIKTEEITSAVSNIKEEETMSRKGDDSTTEDKFEYINEMINTFYAHRTLYNSVRQVGINK